MSRCLMLHFLNVAWNPDNGGDKHVQSTSDYWTGSVFGQFTSVGSLDIHKLNCRLLTEWPFDRTCAQSCSVIALCRLSSDRRNAIRPYATELNRMLVKSGSDYLHKYLSEFQTTEIWILALFRFWMFGIWLFTVYVYMLASFVDCNKSFLYQPNCNF